MERELKTMPLFHQFQGLLTLLKWFPLIVVLAGCPKPPSVETLMTDAKRLQQGGDAKAAVIQLKNVLQQEPTHSEARYLLGKIYLQAGEASSAEKQFREVLIAKYQPQMVLPMLAQALFQQGEFQKLLDETRSSDHGEAALQPEIFSLRGHSQLSLGRMEEAAASFDEALKRQPNFAHALLGKVRLSIQRGDAHGALDLANRAIAADPRSIDGWLMKGDLEQSFNRLDAASAAYHKALDLDKNGIAANFNLASMNLAVGRLDVARNHIEAIRKAAPDSPVGYYLLGLVELRGKNFAAADAAAQRVLKALPNHLPSMALSGSVAYSIGANDQAERQLQSALERYPNSIYLRKLFAATLLKSRKVQQALDVLKPALEAAPNDVHLLTLTAEAHYQKRDVATATRYFELAAKQSPDNPKVRTGLGLARLAAGETDRALADLEMAVQFGGGEAEMFLVTSLLSSRQFDKALAAVSRLEKSRPNDPATFNLKGATLLGRRDMAGARKAFERALELQPGYLAASMNLAQLDIKERNPQAARARYEKILEREKSNVEVVMALANLAAITGAQDDAIALFERAKQLQPKLFSASLALAKQYFKGENYPKAIVAAKEALEIQSENAEALDILGYSQLKNGMSSESLATYTKLVTLNPKSPQALYGLGSAQANTGSPAAAELTLKKALALKPDFAEALASLSTLQMRAGKIGEAVKSASQIQKQYPKASLGYAIEGDAYMTDKKYAPAAHAYEAAFRIEKSAILLIKLHGALRGASRRAEGDALLVDWLKQRPDDTQVRFYYADAAIKSGDYKLAIEQYQIEQRRQPQNLALLHNIAWCYEQLKDIPKALEIAESAYKVNSDNPVVLNDLARLLLESNGDAARAIKLLEKALVIAPASQSIRYYLAKAYLKNDEKGRARLTLEQLLRGREDFPERAEAMLLFDQLQK